LSVSGSILADFISCLGSQSDTVTNSKTFYNLILNFLQEADKKEEVNDLLVWWNRQVLSTALSSARY
jgi:hypothetical protein